MTTNYLSEKYASPEALFVWRGDTLYGKNARCAVRAYMPDDQRYTPNVDTTYYASERFAAFSLLPNTLRHFCDSNHGGKTTLIARFAHFQSGS
ncbi:MAG TPA: hypothetical protein VI542_14150 [Candidatus Tectomicrobia bacterium]